MTYSLNYLCKRSNNLKSQLAKLNKQLITYLIVDRQGISRGEVKDIYYDANSDLNLLIRLGKADNKLNIRRLGTADICQIDSDNQLILSNLSYQQLENLPLYQPIPTHIQEALSESAMYDDCRMNPAHDSQQLDSPETYQIPLLEERLQVSHRRQKIGEVVVRKQIETRMVQVPVRQEKLIVERIGNNPEQLTEVIIGENNVNGFSYEELNDTNSLYLTKSHYLDPETAQKLLEAIVLSSASNSKIRLEIVTTSSQQQVEHQNICDRYHK
ncbi:MAG: YsnF/AvaK domain-containing protein [Cyanobacteria bacterium J06621_8]